MIKPLVRWSITLGIAGASFFSWGILENLIANALPQEQVLEKLDPVPVFTIADEQGAPLVASGEDQAKVAGVFISQDDANQFVNQLKTENPELAQKVKVVPVSLGPELAQKVKVVPVSLGEVYKLAESAKTQENPLNFAYVPEQEAVSSAKTIGEANQQPYKGGVPLFVARGGEGKGYLTFERNSQQVIPFFFDKQQLEQMVARFKEQEPEVAANVNIEVHPLEGVIETLETGSDEILQKIVLVPSSESIEFLQNVAAPPAGEQGTIETTPEAAPTPVAPQN